MIQLREESNQINAYILQCLIPSCRPVPPQRYLETDRGVSCSELGELSFQGQDLVSGGALAFAMRVMHFGEDIAENVANLTNGPAVAQPDLAFARLNGRELRDDHGSGSTNDHGDKSAMGIANISQKALTT